MPPSDHEVAPPFTLFDTNGKLPGNGCPVFLVHECCDTFPHQVFGLVSKDHLDGRITVRVNAAGAQSPYPFAGCFHDSPELLLALTQRIFNHLAFGNIPNGRENRLLPLKREHMVADFYWDSSAIPCHVSSFPGSASIPLNVSHGFWHSAKRIGGIDIQRTQAKQFFPGVAQPAACDFIDFQEPIG